MKAKSRLERWWRGRELGLERLNGSEVSLTEVPLDVRVCVSRIDASDDRKVHRLAALGILPGATIRLVRNRGAFIAVVDRDHVAFDAQVARCVWVRAADDDGAGQRF